MKIRQFSIIVLFFLSIVVLERQFSIWWGKYSVNKNPITTYTYAEALEKAKTSTSTTPILLNFSAYWCPACRELERNIFSDPEVQQLLTEKTYYVRLEQTDNAHDSLFADFEISAYPTLILLDAQRGISRTITAHRNVDDFLLELSNQLESTL